MQGIPDRCWMVGGPKGGELYAVPGLRGQLLFPELPDIDDMIGSYYADDLGVAPVMDIKSHVYRLEGVFKVYKYAGLI